VLAWPKGNRNSLLPLKIRLLRQAIAPESVRRARFSTGNGALLKTGEVAGMNSVAVLRSVDIDAAARGNRRRTSDNFGSTRVGSKLKCPLFVASEMSGFKVVPSPIGLG
jgi:hypothetical protein